jgi:DNA-binding response OmpR family regulator
MKKYISKVLVIDDEKDIREIINEFLRGEQLESVCASSMSEAMEIIKQQEITAILCDLNMPDGSGIEFLTALRAQGKLQPITFVTAFESKNFLIEALRLGAFDYLSKPFDPQELMNVTFRMLEVGKILRAVDDNINNLNLGIADQIELQRIYTKIGPNLVNNFLKRAAKKAA